MVLAVSASTKQTDQLTPLQPTALTSPLLFASAKSLKINYNGTTNISNITNDENANAPVYNIQGMRMGKNLPKGIYIKSGKKFVVK